MSFGSCFFPSRTRVDFAQFADDVHICAQYSVDFIAVMPWVPFVVIFVYNRSEQNLEGRKHIELQTGSKVAHLLSPARYHPCVL